MQSATDCVCYKESVVVIPGAVQSQMRLVQEHFRHDVPGCLLSLWSAVCHSSVLHSAFCCQWQSLLLHEGHHGVRHASMMLSVVMGAHYDASSSLVALLTDATSSPAYHHL